MLRKLRLRQKKNAFLIKKYVCHPSHVCSLTVINCSSMQTVDCGKGMKENVQRNLNF